MKNEIRICFERWFEIGERMGDDVTHDDLPLNENQHTVDIV